MVINKDAHTAELAYAGQEIETTETAASFDMYPVFWTPLFELND